MIALSACGVLGELGELAGDIGEIEELIGNIDDFADETQQDNTPQNTDYAKWWTSPFYVKGTWGNASSYDPDAEPEPLEACYDGTEFVVYAEVSYYAHEKNGTVYSFMLSENVGDATRFESSSKSVADYVENGAAYIPSIIYYTTLFHEYPDNWKKAGSEKLNGFDCDIYDFESSMIVYTLHEKVWFDKATGLAVKAETSYDYVDDTMDTGEAYVKFEITQFDASGKTKVSDLFDLNDYGGDPDEVAAALKAVIPQPTSGTIKKETSSKYTYSLSMDWQIADAKAYAEILRGLGFTVNETVQDYDYLYSFYANNEEGYSVSVNDYIGITLYSPSS